MDWLSSLRSVLTRRFQSELGLVRAIDTALTAIRVTDTAIIRMDTTDRIDTMATILGHHTIGPTDIAITATTVIITTIGTKLT